MEEQSRGRALERVKAIVKESDRSPMGAMKKIMQENPDIANMSIGEANFDPPAELVETACAMLKDTVNRKSLYTSTRGLPSTREAVARYLKRWCGAAVDPEENILMTVGGTEALHLAVKALLEPGDKVLVPDPGWGPAAGLCARQGAELIYYELKKADAWTIDVDVILSKLDESIKVLIVNSPSNPTGAMITAADDWKRIMEAARDKGVFVISDEVYHAYSYIGPYASALPHDPTLENLLIVNSFSKGFAIMGWRLGFAVGHPWLIRQMDVYKETVSACSPSIAQWAIGEYLDDSEDYLTRMKAMCRDNMDKMVAQLNAIPGVDCPPAQGGFYLFPDFSAIEPSSAEMAQRLLRGGVAVAMGGAFGPHGEGCARLLFSAYWPDIDKAVGRIAKALT
jgi:aspartate/methionine/tyrosine aminotransferase